MTEYVYLLETKAEGKVYTKIGYSSDPISRLRDLQVGSPFPARLTYVFASVEAKRMEGLLHNAYAARRVSGEWFNVPSGEIVTTINNLIVPMEVRYGGEKVQPSPAPQPPQPALASTLFALYKRPVFSIWFTIAAVAWMVLGPLTIAGGWDAAAPATDNVMLFAKWGLQGALIFLPMLVVRQLLRLDA